MANGGIQGNATVNVYANPTPFNQGMAAAFAKFQNMKLNVGLNANSLQPLGRITGQVSELNKSLEAANARVVAFGASAGSIFLIERAIRGVISATVEVQKGLADINVVLGTSASGMEEYGKNLFNIIRNTSSSFRVASEAAAEFSRQGLGVEESLKRTNAALILTRLSGLNVAESMRALTASINSFTESSLDATEIVNKLAAVDTSFAVNTADMTQALTRVGSAAADAGVSFDQLIALVTTAQQVTARGGAVIGNSLKTIFTRLQRGKNQDLLESIGVSTKDENGDPKNMIQILKDLAKVYDTLGSSQKSAVAEQIGGVFQINILKAALSDLGKQYSVYDKALETSLNATDEATQRNEKLNQTISALSNQALANLQQAAAKIGSITFEPKTTNFLKNFNDALSSINNADSNGFGAKIGGGLLQGLANFVSGPGAILLAGVGINMFRKFAGFAKDSFKEVLGLNDASKERAALEQSVLTTLSSERNIIQEVINGTKTQAQAAQELTAYYYDQAKGLEIIAALSKEIAASASSRLTIGVVDTAHGPATIPKVKAGGYLPENLERMSAYMHGYTPGAVSKTRLWDGKGGSFESYTNSAEKIINFINADGKKATMVIPPNGFAADGFLPNFAQSIEEKIFKARRSPSAMAALFRTNPEVVAKEFPEVYAERIKARELGVNASTLGRQEQAERNAEEKAARRELTTLTQDFVNQYAVLTPNRESPITNLNAPLRKIKIGGKFLTGLSDAYRVSINVAHGGANIENFDAMADKEIGPAIDRIGTEIYPIGQGGKGILLSSGQKAHLYGNIFEGAINKIFGLNPIENARLDVESVPASMANFFGVREGIAADIKRSTGVESSASMIGKIMSMNPAFERQVQQFYNDFITPASAAGFIPHFAYLDNVLGLEEKMSGRKAKFYSTPFPHVRNSDQPTFEDAMRDHGGLRKALKDSVKAQKAYGIAAGGFVPNFAETDGDGIKAGSSADIGIGSMLAGLQGVALMLAFIKNPAAQANQELKHLVENLDLSKTGTLKFNDALKRNESLVKTKELTENQRAANVNLYNKQPNAYNRDVAHESIRYMLRAQDDYNRNFDPSVASEKEARDAYNARVAQLKAESAPSRAFALGAAAQIIAPQLANFIPQNTNTGRGIAAATTSAGNVAGLASTGFMIGSLVEAGGAGAAIGAIVATLSEANSIWKAFTSKSVDLQNKVEQTTDTLNKFNSSGQTYLSALERAKDLKDSNTASEADKQKAETRVREAFSNLPDDLKGQISGFTDASSAQEQYAKMQEILIKRQASEQIATNLEAKINDNNDTFTSRASGAVGSLLYGLPASIEQGLGIDGNYGQAFASNALQALNGKALDDKQGNLLGRSLIQSALAGRNTDEKAALLKDISKNLVGKDTAGITAYFQQNKEKFNISDDFMDIIKKALVNPESEAAISDGLVKAITTASNGVKSEREFDQNRARDEFDKEKARSKQNDETQVSLERYNKLYAALGKNMLDFSIAIQRASSTFDLISKIRDFQSQEKVNGLKDSAGFQRIAGFTGVSSFETSASLEEINSKTDKSKREAAFNFNKDIATAIRDFATSNFGAIEGIPQDGKPLNIDDSRRLQTTADEKTNELADFLHSLPVQVREAFQTGNLNVGSPEEMKTLINSITANDKSAKGLQDLKDLLARKTDELININKSIDLEQKIQTRQLAAKTINDYVKNSTESALKAAGGFDNWLEQKIPAGFDKIGIGKGDIENAKNLKFNAQTKEDLDLAQQTNARGKANLILGANEVIGGPFLNGNSDTFKEIIEAQKVAIRKQVDDAFRALGGKTEGHQGSLSDADYKLAVLGERIHPLPQSKDADQFWKRFQDNGGETGAATLQTFSKLGFVTESSLVKNQEDKYKSLALEQLRTSGPDGEKLAKSLSENIGVSSDPIVAAINTSTIDIVRAIDAASKVQSGKSIVDYMAASVNGYGLREDGTRKASGYFGPLKRPDGRISSELSAGVNINGKDLDIPLLTPNLDRKQIDSLLAGGKPTKDIIQKAVEFAQERMKQGKSVWAGTDEKPYPLPAPSEADRVNAEINRQRILEARANVKRYASDEKGDYDLNDRARRKEDGFVDRNGPQDKTATLPGPVNVNVSTVNNFSQGNFDLEAYIAAITKEIADKLRGEFGKGPIAPPTVPPMLARR